MMTDPFQHLSHLRDQITPGEKSNRRFTPERLAEADKGRPANWRRTDGDIESAWRAFLCGRPKTEDLWIFGYGSLMWDPGFRFAEVRQANVADYQRRFTLKIDASPGFVDRPMLVTALERRPGSCGGLAFRIPVDLIEPETEVLWRRELVFFDYLSEELDASTPQGVIKAVAFTPNPADPRYQAECTPEETASIIASGRSTLGTNQASLTRLASFLHLLGVEDRYVEDLKRRVDSLNGT